MRRFHRQNVSNTIWWVKFAPEWSSNLSLSSSQFKFFLIFAFFPVFWFDFYVNLRWCTRDTRAPTFFRGCLPGLMLHWFTTVFKEVNIPRYLQVFLKDLPLSITHSWGKIAQFKDKLSKLTQSIKENLSISWTCLLSCCIQRDPNEEQHWILP